MARAVLQIDGDTSGLAAAFGAATRAAREAENAARRTGNAYRNSARDMVAAERSVAAEAQRAVSAHVRAEQQKVRAARMSADARKRAEQEATRVAQEESRKRGLSAEQEARVKQNALERFTRLYEQEERKQTATTEREARNRARSLQQTRRAEQRGVERVASAAGTAGTAAVGFAGSAIGMVRDARQARAASARQLTHAVMGSGGSAADVTSTQRSVQAFALRTGMTTDEVSSALIEGQQRGSVLQPGEGQTRQQALDAALETVAEANATGTNAGAMLAARGRLSGLGLRGDALKEAMRYSLRAADLGNVEVDQIIQQGLPGASRLMATRTAMLGPGATDEQRQQVALAAFRESVAFQEVTAGEGNAPRNMANTLANLQTFLRTPRRQEAILTNIRTAEEQANVNTPEGLARRNSLRALRESMFEVDPTRTGGAMRMKAGATPLELAARLTSASGGDANAAMAMLAGTGQGNAQSILANMRGVLEFLGRTNASGQTGGARVTEMMGTAGVTDAEIAERRRVVEGDEQSRINRLEETRLSALTNNTTELTRLTNSIDQFNARNPLMGAGIVAGGGAAVAALGAKGTAMLGTGLLAGEGARAVITGEDLTGRKLSASERVFRGVSSVMGGVLAGPAGFLASQAMGGVRDVAGVVTNNAPEGATGEVMTQVQRALADLSAVLRGGITATMDPTAAQQAATLTPAAGAPAR